MAGGTAAEPRAGRASGWRRGLALVGHLADAPSDELMAMVWGPRFDREQAMALLARWPRTATTALHVIGQAADRWDALAPHQQARLRRRLMDNAACPACC